MIGSIAKSTLIDSICLLYPNPTGKSSPNYNISDADPFSHNKIKQFCSKFGYHSLLIHTDHN